MVLKRGRRFSLLISTAGYPPLIDELWQQLLDKLRPSVQGQNRNYSARFQTSDVLQESAIQMIGELEKSDSDEFNPPQEWLNKVGRGHASKLRDRHTAQKRSTKRESSLSSDTRPADCLPPDEVVAQQEMSRRIVLLLAVLEPDQRTIIDRHFTKQESFAEIARAMERPPEWVRRQYKKAIGQLRSMVGESDTE